MCYGVGLLALLCYAACTTVMLRFGFKMNLFKNIGKKSGGVKMISQMILNVKLVHKVKV